EARAVRHRPATRVHPARVLAPGRHPGLGGAHRRTPIGDRGRRSLQRRAATAAGMSVMPIDSTRLEELQIVRRIRETVRRWWGIELSFTDARGLVLQQGKGIIVPPQNRICTACLGDREGLRRCNQSIEKAVQKLSSGTALLGPCHMGLEIVATPISFDGARQGALFACGFLVEEKAEDARDRALTTVDALSLQVE